MIGREKLDEAFKILDSFKEDEIKVNKFQLFFIIFFSFSIIYHT
jgi:hypothetical protein